MQKNKKKKKYECIDGNAVFLDSVEDQRTSLMGRFAKTIKAQQAFNNSKKSTLKTIKYPYKN